jgi:glutathione S-transferase
VKLYGVGPAPGQRRVRIFLAEKGITVPIEPIDQTVEAHESEELGGLDALEPGPVLVLDDDSLITDAMAICRYFEALRPEPPLFGHGAKEQALVEMWNRRVELNLYRAASAVFDDLHAAAKDAGEQMSEWTDPNKPGVAAFLELLDRELKDHLFVAGDHFSVADITTLVSIDVMGPAKQALPETLPHIRRWHAQVSARQSAAA